MKQNMSYVNFNRQKDLAFASSANADPNTIYFTSDTNEIVVQGKSYGSVNLNGYATEQWVEEQNYLTEHQDISNKVDVSDFEEATKVTSATLNFFHSNTLWQTEDTYVRCDKSKTLEEAVSGEADIVYFTTDTNEIVVQGKSYGSVNLNGYATEQWVEEQNYLTEHQDISNKVDVSDFEEATKVTSATLNFFHSNTLWQTEDTYVRCDKSKTLEEAVSGEADIVYFTTDSHQIFMNGRPYSNISLYQQYQLYGGTVSEDAFAIILKYHLTPFLIATTGDTVIPDDILNSTGTNFVTEYYWNLMRIAGGEPVMTSLQNGDVPSRLKGVASGKEYEIDFTNKVIRAL